MARTKNDIDLARLQVQIRQTTLKRLQDMADEEIVPVAVIVRRVLDQFVKENSDDRR